MIYDSNKSKEYLIQVDGDWKHVEGIFQEPLGNNRIEIPEDADCFVVWDKPFQCAFYKDDFKKIISIKGVPTEFRVWESCPAMNLEHISRCNGFVVWKREKETVNTINNNEFNPLIPQEGGNHYKLRPIQPIEYSERNGLSMSQGNIIKYITRHKEKNGVEDLAKVVHYALLEAYFVYDIKGSTELKQRILKILGD